MDNANVFANNKAQGGALMDRPFRPLDGIRVVEMSHMIMGPSCGMFLALLGAEVVKVEPPEGSPARSFAPVRQGVSLSFAFVHVVMPLRTLERMARRFGSI